MIGKRILIAGGAGSIGKELVKQLAPDNKIYIIDNSESSIFETVEPLKEDHWVYGRVCDIRDYAAVKDVFEDFKPQIVINAAALKHVPLSEYTPLEAIKTNVLGHYNLVHIAKTWECVEKFVFISTDKVLGGSVMGATKRLSEVVTRNQGYIVVRFANVLGSRGSVTEIWKDQHNKQKPLTITDIKMTRYFMTIEEAVGLVVKATEEGQGGDLYILDPGESKNILDLKNELYPQDQVTVTGIREGEVLEERLMTEEEEKVAQRKGKFWIIK